MCLTKEETKKATVGWVALMVGLLLNFTTFVWWASDTNRRVMHIEEQMSEGARFTQAEGDVHEFQINRMLEIMANLGVTMRDIKKALVENRVALGTHTHDHSDRASP